MNPLVTQTSWSSYLYVELWSISPRSCQIFLPANDYFFGGEELSKNNGGTSNKNNIRTNNERSGGKGTQVIASITPLHYMDPFIGITPGSREVDYKTLAKVSFESPQLNEKLQAEERG